MAHIDGQETMNKVTVALLYSMITFKHYPVQSHSFSVMVKCWALDPNDRPNFEKLATSMGKLLQAAAGYLELNMVLLPETKDEDTY